ncbi:MAG: tRNA 2-thiouridine(34) synthase MnmA [Gammaproteobacteria bacterium]|nr:tRNA 2-thiouridine(34) synthase MnmA [Gammaproteobacteria bacterium]
MTQRVVVGMSGGVDSSVAALLLKEQGYAVEALFMKNWKETASDGSCLWETDVRDAMEVCDRLGIAINTVDLSAEYWQGVFAGFLHEYDAGRTPNPDVLCNQEVKFKAFLNFALGQSADLLATGHYARIAARNGSRLLLKGADAGKDQSYFLCRLTQAQLQRSMFPVGDLLKADVRKLAARAGLATHAKKDSTGICFVGERPFRDFLSRFLPARPGEIFDADGRVLGKHEGVHFYTIGQRQGLGIGGVSGMADAAWYVARKDPVQNTLLVVQGHDHPLLFSRRLRACGIHWLGMAPDAPLRCTAKIRYRQPDQGCVIDAIDGERVTVTFDKPQRAIAPGQYVVFYDTEACIGSAVIDNVD